MDSVQEMYPPEPTWVPPEPMVETGGGVEGGGAAVAVVISEVQVVDTGNGEAGGGGETYTSEQTYYSGQEAAQTTESQGG